MRIFVRVAETASFAETARQMHLSPPAVTRAISYLEDEIGVRLLARTTRSVKMTEAGQRYFDDCRRILADIAEAEASAAGSHGNPAGTLVVTAPVMFGQMHVLPILLDYLDLYPRVTGRSLFLDRSVNIVEEGIDVAIRIGNLPRSGPDRDARRLGAPDDLRRALLLRKARGSPIPCRSCRAPCHHADRRLGFARVAFRPGFTH
ncbi:transcriptional regulator [Novosphingobium sp. AP12]|nr:transcriptional regulator [Novosphingobium sp. AP12]